MTLRFTRPGKAVGNCVIESFNGTFRTDRLDASWSENLEHARRVIQSWRPDHNHDRSHAGAGDLAPAESAALREPVAPSDLQTPRTTRH